MCSGHASKCHGEGGSALAERLSRRSARHLYGNTSKASVKRGCINDQNFREEGMQNGMSLVLWLRMRTYREPRYRSRFTAGWLGVVGGPLGKGLFRASSDEEDFSDVDGPTADFIEHLLVP